jgi:hypothetical protein
MRPEVQQEATGTTRPFFQRSPTGFVMNVAWGYTVGRTIYEHYQATGDWRTAAHAGVRGALRWGAFISAAFMVGVLFLGYLIMAPFVVFATIQGANVDAAQITGYELLPYQREPTSLAVLVLNSILVLVPWVLLWFVYPYCIGVLWVRYADRSLLRVNRNWLYRRLLPFAYQMRNVGDFVLFLGMWFPFLAATGIFLLSGWIYYV